MSYAVVAAVEALADQLHLNHSTWTVSFCEFFYVVESLLGLLESQVILDENCFLAIISFHEYTV